MEATILAILEDVIHDFNSKWTSHDELNNGLEEYSKQIMGLINNLK